MFKKVREYLDNRYEAGALKGGCLSITLSGNPVFDYCFGYLDEENKTAVKTDDLFRIASMTKPVTAVACLIAEEKKLLSLDDQICMYYPQFSQMQVGKIDENGVVVKSYAAKRNITLRDILTHSSGLGSGIIGLEETKDFNFKDKSLEDSVKSYASIMLEFSPGEGCGYSPVAAFDVLAAIIQKVSKKPLYEFLKENIFFPLGMYDTAYEICDEKKGRVSKLFSVNSQSGGLDVLKIPDELGYLDYPIGFQGGSAGLFSTCQDYQKFALMLLNGGEYNGVRVVNKESVDSMIKSKKACENPYFDWGYGVRVVKSQRESAQDLPIGSFGWSGAFNTHFWVDRTNNLTAVFMSNVANNGGADSPDARGLERAVMEDLRDLL